MMLNQSVSLNGLIAWTCLVVGALVLILAGVDAIPLHFAASGSGLCFLGNWAYFYGRLERMDARERHAFDMGRESAEGSVRSLR